MDGMSSSTPEQDNFCSDTLDANMVQYGSSGPDPSGSQPNQSVDPGTGQPTQSVDPNASQQTQSVDPGAGQPNQSVDPGAGQSTQSVDPNASQQTQSVDPGAGEPNQSVDPGAGQSTQSVDPNASQQTQSVDPGAGQPNQSVDPGAGQPSQSVDPNANQQNQQSDLRAGPPNQSVDPGAGQPNQSIDTGSADYKQGYQDGSSGAEQNGIPRVDEALAAYDKGYEDGKAATAAQTQCDPATDTNSADYKAGYQDGFGGKDQKAAPQDPTALAAYKEGFTAGQKAKAVDWDEVEEEVAKEGFALVFWHFAAHKIVHVLHIGTGVVAFIISMTVELECDTRMYRYKCPTCGVSGDPECTLEEAQADAEKHHREYPDHQPEAVDPMATQ